MYIHIPYIATHPHKSHVGEAHQILTNKKKVRLVAVSKLKPANDILALHRPPAAAAAEAAAAAGGVVTPHVHFGENYAQELAGKAALLPPSVQWHFIGGLQSTHCKTLARIPNLFAVSSVDSAKKASLLNKARGDFFSASASASASSEKEEEDNDNNNNKKRQRKRKINIHIQVNTSGEESKSGCPPGADVVALSRHVLTECPHLRLLGFMTIGAIARSVATTPETENEDFAVLRAQRDLVAEELKDLLEQEEQEEDEEEDEEEEGGMIVGGRRRGGKGEKRELELSMGMSEDFEGAIAMGSSEVRVGSTIFGTRPANKADAKLVV